MLAFIASLAFMALEMVAGRLVERHTGSSVYGWTSVIGVLLGGLSLGNYLGGKIADHPRREAGELAVPGRVGPDPVRPADRKPAVVAVRNPIEHFPEGKDGVPLAERRRMPPAGIYMSGYAWWFRVLFWTTAGLLRAGDDDGHGQPARRQAGRRAAAGLKRTGTAIGQVYAWGMVGSILGTFLTGFSSQGIG